MVFLVISNTEEESIPAYRVLIVEDEIIVALSLERSLGSFGYDVVGLATKGSDAIRIAEELHPDIALIDINLEDEIDGIDVAERLREIGDIPFVYLTSYSGDEILKRAIGTKPYGYLTKPARPREIYTTIETVLNKHKAVKAERERLDSEEKYRKIFNHISIPLLIFAIEGGDCKRIIEVNESFCRMAGRTPDDLVGMEVEDFLSFDENDLRLSLLSGENGRQTLCEISVPFNAGIGDMDYNISFKRLDNSNSLYCLFFEEERNC
ncbi:response regulator [Methanoplanus endosymbiosus]|uniref:Response regulator n=1 Tax=Methanoplanus endosymbiosus TaxID=33865 RepID=A0A9E7PMB8_9EURY|nr:response regulator [Methanoplanus endosymbiosus]UUX91281.1 response regulator [Methanoplanus endosymbiosus]